MVGLDEDALICDFAETYHIFNWRQLPARMAATLAMGLGPDSRIFKKINEAPAPVDTLLLAMIADSLRILLWRGTKDGQKGKNPPDSILQKLYGTAVKKTEDLEGFDTVDDFEKWRAEMIGGKNA